MGMRETVGSMRTYLALVGVVSAAVNIKDLVMWWVKAPLVVPFALAGLGLSLVLLYVAIALRKLLKQSPTVVICIVLTVTGYFVTLSLLIGLLTGFRLAEVARAVIAALIAWYLVANARRLSSELQGAQVDEPPADQPPHGQ